MADLGTDIRAVDDLDPTMRLVSDREQLAQAIARRLGTKRGELAHIGDSSDYGYDLKEMINDDTGPRATFEVEANVEREVLKDERVFSAKATATLASTRLTIALQLTDSVGPFVLVLAASAVTVEILRVQ